MRAAVLGVGGLRLRLASAFVAVALASIVMLSVLTEIGIGRDINVFIEQRQLATTRSIAVSVGALYAQPPAGWQVANLGPVLALITRQGNSAQIRDARGNVVRSTPRFGQAATAPQDTVPVTVRGHRVGSVTVRFHSPSLSAAIRGFEAERLRASLTAAGLAALLAAVAALAVSRRLTLPLERMLAGVRARAAGDRSARIRAVRGPVRELAAALNEASDAVDERDRQHRDFVADVAHQLRTPVTVLQAGHEAMIDGITPATAEQLVSQQQEVRRLSRMIDDLQRLAAAEAAALHLELSRHDLATIAAEAAASMVGSIAAAGITLRTRLNSAPAPCDPGRVREIIDNLLTNARKFTPASGTVTMTTGFDARGRPAITIADTGIGIPPDELPRIAERFFRGRHSPGIAPGSGIGLAIVTELARAQRATFAITSQPGKGTQATITFPATGNRSGRGTPV